MQSVNLLNDPLFATGRRAFIGKSGILLSASAVALLAGREGLAAGAIKDSSESIAADVRILNTALGAEQQAIAAYRVALVSGLLEKPVQRLAVQFQDHHKKHADVIATTISKFGGKPVVALRHYAFPVDKLKNQADVLSFAAGLEQGAVSAYLGAVPAFHDRDLSKAAASILGDEAMHWAILRQGLGQNPVPAAFVS